MRLLRFPEPEEQVDQKGKALYDKYRALRVQQGWEEWKWESLTKPQQLVWMRLIEQLQGE